MLRTPSRGSVVLAKSPRLYYPFGNTRIRNVLKDYNFDINCENTDTTKVMWCHFFFIKGVYSLRRMLPVYCRKVKEREQTIKN